MAADDYVARTKAVNKLFLQMSSKLPEVAYKGEILTSYFRKHPHQRNVHLVNQRLIYVILFRDLKSNSLYTSLGKKGTSKAKDE